MNMSIVKKTARRTVGAALMVGLLASTSARKADAKEPSANSSAGPHDCAQEGRPPLPGPFGPQRSLDFTQDRPPPYLMGLTLSEEQQDKIFAILHAAAPAIRDHMKAARKAHDELRDLAQSAAFTSDKANALAQAESVAGAQLSLLLARNDHDIFIVLTPEQRAHLTERERDRRAPPHDGPPPH
jgi:periplasmic protein CpxP/Spy